MGLNHVKVVSEEDAQMLLHTWNQTQATFPTKHGTHLCRSTTHSLREGRGERHIYLMGLGAALSPPFCDFPMSIHVHYVSASAVV